MERIENPMIRPIIEVYEDCERCEGSGVIEATTCDYCKQHRLLPCNREKCMIADIPIGLDCPECGGRGFHIIER